MVGNGSEQLTLAVADDAQTERKLVPVVLSCDTKDGSRRRARLNFVHEIFWATTPETLPLEWLQRFKTCAYKTGETRRLALMSCFHSHMRIWQRIKESNEGLLICEDDVLWKRDAGPLPTFPSGITYIGGKLNHPTNFEKFRQADLKALVASLEPGLQPFDDDRYSITGTIGYYVDPASAIWLLQQFEHLRVMRHVDCWLRKLLRKHAWPRSLLVPSPVVHCGISNIASCGALVYVENYVLHKDKENAKKSLVALGLMDRRSFDEVFS